MADQKDERVQDKKEETEDTEGHGLMGGPKQEPRTPGNPTGDDSPVDDDSNDGMIPKRIIPKR